MWGSAFQGTYSTILAESTISSGQMLLVVVVFGVVAVMMVSARRRRPRNANSPRAYVREQLARINEEAEVKDDLETLLIQVQELTRQMNAQLDTKFRKLEAVIGDADQRIGKLDRLLRMAEGRPVCDVTVGDGSDEPAADSRGETKDRPYADIHQLADAGVNAVEIASQTGFTTGEVELILALRPKSAPPVSV